MFFFPPSPFIDMYANLFPHRGGNRLVQVEHEHVYSQPDPAHFTHRFENVNLTLS